jgi:hypothetical protein
MPEEAFYLEGIQLAKRGVALDIQRFFPETKAVKFTETFRIERKKAHPEETESKKVETKEPKKKTKREKEPETKT